MKTLSIDGTLIKKNQPENIENKEGKKWIKQTFILDTGADYNNQICFQLFGEEKIKLLSEHQIGDTIEVFFNISSREYNQRYYHNIDAWKIVKMGKEDTATAIENTNTDNSSDNLPF